MIEPAPRAHAPLPPIVQPRFAELSVDQAMATLAGLGDLWQPDAAWRSGEHEDNKGGIRYRVGKDVLYGIVDVGEASFGPGALPLQRATEDAYRRIFALIDCEGFPYVWRTWNYLARINAVEDNLERYRQFDIGRHDAFVASQRLARGNVPAACALGTPGTMGGPLTVAFMAGRAKAVAIENPRQISAYEYPTIYGPRSPTFSRAVFAHLPGRELLFISGTASILGQRTVHLDDIEGQTRETVTNVGAVLRSANDQASAAPYALGELRYRAYIRHAADYPAVRAVLEESLGPDVPVAYVHADICRADLLVEIEATGAHLLDTG